MKKLFVCLLFAAALTAAAPEDLIRKVLDDQTAAWNRGDVKAFMEGYEDSPSTTFVGATVIRGHASVLANYSKRYPTNERMGALRFSDVEIRLLGSNYASVLGRFHLDRDKDSGGEANGIFTLLFKRTPQGWKVILDHTS